MERVVGLDFGTTNSALAVAEAGGAVKLARFGVGELFRSVLYFNPDEAQQPARARPVTGPGAIDAWMEDEGAGRLMQSLKTWLSSGSFEATQVGRHKWTLDELIGALLQDLRAKAERELGPLGSRAVVGRPVHLSRPVDAARDAFGVERLRRALGLAGFTDVRFEFEPVAAAFHYERRLTQDELVLIGDFGGGTSDFSLIRVGPGARARGYGAQDLLGTSGVALAGNEFDSRLVMKLVAPELGVGSSYRTFTGKVLEIPPSVFRLRWHELSVMRSKQAEDELREYLMYALEPAKLDAYLYLIRCDLGYALYRAVEGLKIALSKQEEAEFCFEEGPIQIRRRATRAQFEGWIKAELDTLGRCVDELLEGAGVEPGQVDRVFLTGGSSFIPAVKGLFASRFGADKLRSGDELTSVVSGLALRGLGL
jgi:hypothetical chaperone protein